LKKNFPNTPNLGDITKVDWNGVERPELICGGFPCQDISVAGKGKGIKEGTRSGLWFEFAKAIGVLRPRYALIENVPMLANRGLNIVLADLAKMGYDAEWGCLSAAEVGANHKRERLFVFAYDSSKRCNDRSNNREERQICEAEVGSVKEIQQKGNEWQSRNDKNIKTDVVHPNIFGLERRQKTQLCQFPEFSWCKDVRRIADLRNRPDIPEPLVCGAGNGASKRLDNYIRIERTKAIGNAVVPAVAQQIGEWILEFEQKEETKGQKILEDKG
jgi:site-specific DNA-cytosine methylase